jgi:hypothetical protein
MKTSEIQNYPIFSVYALQKVATHTQPQTPKSIQDLQKKIQVFAI